MRTNLFASLFAFALVLGASPAPAQVCHDWDGDGEEAGFTCPTGTDCEDRSWTRLPGAIETCDGFDNDCDNVLDLGCDRYCDTAVLFPAFAQLEVEGLPEALEGHTGMLENGILVAAERKTEEAGLYDHYVIYTRAYDLHGQPWAPSSAPGEPLVEAPFEMQSALTVGGDRALLVYQDQREHDQEFARLMARVVDARGRPLGPAPTDLSATAPVGSAPWVVRNVPVWDGDRFVVFWAPWGHRRNLLMSVIDAEGLPANPTTVLVSDDPNGEGDTLQDLHAIWTGDQYIVVFWVDSPLADPITLHTVRVSRDGQLLGRGSIPIRAHLESVSLGEDRIAVLLSDRRVTVEPTGTWYYVAFLDLDGDYLTSPGIVTVFSDDNILDGPDGLGNAIVRWTGEMFGAAFSHYVRPGGGSTRRYTWHFSRILPDGTLLDPLGSQVIADDASLGNLVDLQWEGKNFGLYGIRGQGVITRQRLMCSCDDEDGDTFGACSGGLDCDDGDPTVHPGQIENCRGLKDDDCDGLVDCDDTSDCPGGAGPAGVTGLIWNGTGLQWNAPAGAERYDLARGLLSDLARRGDYLQSECAGLEIDGTNWTDDGRKPPQGDLLWYVLRPEGAPCALGTYGTDSSTEIREVNACR